MVGKVTLENYRARLKMDKHLLEKHPDHADMLKRRITESENAILQIINQSTEPITIAFKEVQV